MTNLDLVNVASISGVIPFRLFDHNDAEEGVQLISGFIHFLWANLDVLTCVRNLSITTFMTNLDLVNVASIG